MVADAAQPMADRVEFLIGQPEAANRGWVGVADLVHRLQHQWPRDWVEVALEWGARTPPYRGLLVLHRGSRGRSITGYTWHGPARSPPPPPPPPASPSA